MNRYRPYLSVFDALGIDTGLRKESGVSDAALKDFIHREVRVDDTVETFMHRLPGVAKALYAKRDTLDAADYGRMRAARYACTLNAQQLRPYLPLAL